MHRYLSAALWLGPLLNGIATEILPAVTEMVLDLMIDRKEGQQTT